MPEEAQSVDRGKTGEGDKFIPPPMDPYATYQTPYERRSTPEPNPFIEFRRFADKQLSEMFSTFPAFGALSSIFGMEDGMKNFREQLEKDMKDMLAQQKKMEDYMKSNKDQHPAEPDTTAAASQESIRPPAPAAKERAQISKQSPSDRYHTIATLDGKNYSYDKFTGQITEKAVEQSIRDQDDHSSARARWRRGFRNCPELQKYQGHTELDVYESLEDHQDSSEPMRQLPQRKSSWSSWLSAYGHDGRQRLQRAKLTDPLQDKGSEVPPCEITTYLDRHTKWMDPFKHDHDFVPWLFLSRYSPLFLARADLTPVKSIRLHNGCEGSDCGQKLHLIEHTEHEQPASAREARLRSSIADHLQWCDAFEDLMSLEKTGRMLWRDDDNMSEPSEQDPDWLREMVDRGSMGPNWWVKDNGVMRAHQSSHHNFHPWTNLQSYQHNDDRDEFSQRENVGMSKDFMDKVAEDYLDTFPPGFGATQDDEAAVNVPNKNKDLSLEKTEEQLAKNVQAPKPSSENLTMHKDENLVVTAKPSIISTLTTMTSRTLPDGSVETKRVLKTRFADGKEESEESTELIHPQPSDPDSKRETGLSKQGQNRPGWFWT